jgi:ZIP family zinc transporter
VSTLIDYYQLLLLGAFAGFTIFLGFPVALMNFSQKKKAFLNALAIGILVFLVIDVFGHAWESVTTSVISSIAGRTPMIDGVTALITMFAGIAIGLIGLAIYESRYMKGTAKTESKLENNMVWKDAANIDRFKLATMIAIGIGAHNFSEGLSIGQSYVSGAIGLALLLIIGFAAHNATEGFGILGPLTSSEKRLPVSFLVRLGLIGGGPTFLGTLLGSIWVSPILYILFLSFAGGALVFVILLMYSVAVRQTSNKTIMTGIFMGLLFGFMTDLIVSIGGA